LKFEVPGFGEITPKLNDYYKGKCSRMDLINELNNMIIVANRVLHIPEKLMLYIKELDRITKPTHWREVKY